MSILITNNLSRRPELEDAYQQYTPEGNFAATLAFAPLGVDDPRGEIETVRADNALKEVAMDRAANGTYNRITQRLDVINYNLQEKGAEHLVKFGEKNTIQYNKIEGGIRLLKIKRWISREIDFANMLFDDSVFSSDTATAAWSNAATSNPIADVMEAAATIRNRTGMEPNALVLNRANLSNLLMSDNIRQQFQGASIVTQVLLEQSLPAIFGLEYLVVSSAVSNTAALGDTIVANRIVPDDYVSVCKIATPGAPPQDSAVGRTLYWSEDDTDPVDGVVETYMSNEQRGMVIRVRDYQNPVLMDANLGHLIDVSATT
jgi:hypothetical protein